MNGSWYGIVAGALLLPAAALAQSVEKSVDKQIIGAWRLVSLYNEEGGVKRHPYGEKPVGLFVFDRYGNVMQFLSKPDLPKFAVANRLKGTDQEYRQVMESMLSGFGTYTVSGSSVTIRWLASSYPNRAGTTETRTYKIVGNELQGINPTAASGGTSYARYVRARGRSNM